MFNNKKKRNKMKKETAEEAAKKEFDDNVFGYEKYRDGFVEGDKWCREQGGEFAIGFAKWLLANCWLHDDAYWELVTKNGNVRKSEEELLEIFKKEKGL